MRKVDLKMGVYLLLIIFVFPLDLVGLPGFSNHITSIRSYLGGVEIYNADFWLGLGTLLRPISNFMLMCLMMSYTIKSRNA
jgi:hypothetical protein